MVDIVMERPDDVTALGAMRRVMADIRAERKADAVMSDFARRWGTEMTCRSDAYLLELSRGIEEYVAARRYAEGRGAR